MPSNNIYHFESVIEDNGWGCCFAVPVIYANSIKLEDKSRRVVCRINDLMTFQCAIMPFNNNWAISINKARLRELGLKVGSVIQVSLSRDESEYGMAMPEELEEVFAQDPIAKIYFDGLTAGKKRSVMHFVSSIKSTDKRIERALAITQRLIETKGIFKTNELWGG
jgi:hypothetical protein